MLVKISFTLILIFSIDAFGEDDMLVSKCGDKPNCVSSADERKEYFVEPFKFEDPAKGLDELVEKIKNLSRVKLVTHEAGKSAHFVFTTLIMRFKDDLYLEANQDAGLVDVKSESRVGYSDLGKNKERVEGLKNL